MYSWQGVDDLSAYTRTAGTFTVAGDELTFEPDSLITWDAFHGADSPEVVYTPYPYDFPCYDDAHHRIEGEMLTLDYTSYPADAPEPTSRTFRRDR